jgi:endogenous inhibitor of DNA gyrase (YacG/DUF329 family)
MVINMAQGICPICGRKRNDATSNPFFPMCSRRCCDIDLYNWFCEEYVISDPACDNEETEEEKNWGN